MAQSHTASFTHSAPTHQHPQHTAAGCTVASSCPNVGQSERWASVVAGGGLIACGLTQRSGWSLLSLLAGASLVYRGASGHCSLYEKIGVDTTQSDPPRQGVRAGHGRKARWTIHINRDKKDLYDHWRNLENLPKVMRHLKSVTPLDSKRSHWVASGPLGQELSWDAEIISERPGEMIAWQSVGGSQVDTAGSVHFTTPAHGEGTDLSVALKYDPPGGAWVAKVAHLLGQGLEQEVREDLRNFKQLIEAGEIATSASHR